MPVRRGRRRGPLALFAAGLAACACGGGAGAPDRRAAAPAAPDSHNPIQAIAPGEPATPFRVETTAGRVLDSATLIGRRPAVLVFFASWCGICEMSLPIVHRALPDASPDVAVVGVSLDGADTWPAVAGFARREGVTYPIVHGARFPRFVASYDATGRIPLVVVVGRDGAVVDMLIGYVPGYNARFRAALQQAARAPVDERDR